MLGCPPPCEDIAPKRQVSEMAKRTVIVNDKMQKRYRYERTAAVGRNFDPEFKPELTRNRCCGSVCSAAST